jgi:hypothetical protein
LSATRGRGGAEPPEIPHGWTVGPPDFVGVGAQRSGTTWWHGLIRSHPDVVSAGRPRKELHYFDSFHSSAFGDADVAAYHRLFPSPSGAIHGEWTPRYMLDYWTPPLLRIAAPEARILILLRDPIDRLRSGIGHALRRRPRATKARRKDFPVLAFARGLYHEQITRLLEYFPREQVLILQYERCVREPAGELRRTFDFLGLAPFEPPAPADPEPRRPKKPKDELPEHAVAALTRAYRDEMRRVAELAPEVDLDLWPRFR